MARPNKTRFVILGLLSDTPMSGYDIKRQIEEVIDHFWKESYGQIYPTLRDLCADGLAERVEAPIGERRRDTYTITDKGRAALARWLLETPEPGTFRHELLLKMFFGRHTDPDTLIRHVEAYRDRVTGMRRYMSVARDEVSREVPADEQTYWMLTIRSGELVSEAGIAWASEALEMLKQLKATRSKEGTQP